MSSSWKLSALMASAAFLGRTAFTAPDCTSSFAPPAHDFACALTRERETPVEAEEKQAAAVAAAPIAMATTAWFSQLCSSPRLVRTPAWEGYVSRCLIHMIF
jgi:hypothetical protein